MNANVQLWKDNTNGSYAKILLPFGSWSSFSPTYSCRIRSDTQILYRKPENSQKSCNFSALHIAVFREFK